MKRIGEWMRQAKQAKTRLALSDEKIIIQNKRKLTIRNYHQVLLIGEEFIRLSTIEVRGKDLRITEISKYYLHLEGRIDQISFGGGMSDV